MLAGQIHEDFSDYIQDIFTKDEFDDIDVADASMLYGNASSLHYPIQLNAGIVQNYGPNHVERQNFASMNICGTSGNSDGTESYKTGKTDNLSYDSIPVIT